MLAREKVRKLEGKEKSVDLVGKVSSAKLETIGSETHIRPRFANHTLSSLMKTRTPINSRKKSSSMRSVARVSKRSQKSIVYGRVSGIYKKRSVTKQSRSMQAVMTILKQEKKDHRASVSRQDNEVTGTVRESLEYSLVVLSSNLIKDVTQDLKKCAPSPAKSMVSHDESAKVVDQPEKHTKDLHTHFQEKMRRTDSYLSPCLQSNTENILDNIKDRTIINIARQLQSSDEDKKFVNSHRKVKILLHRRSRSNESGEKLAEDFLNEDCSAIETQIHRQIMSASVKDATMDRKCAFRRRNRRTSKEKTEIGHVNDHMYNADLQGFRNSKFARHVDNSRDKDDRLVDVNCAMSTRKKGAFQKNFVFTNQRAWRPPGITRSSIIKSTMSLTQPTSQKSSRSIERSITLTENKHSSIEQIEMLNSEPTNTSIFINQSKILMKENRDPRANRVTKICKNLAEAKQRQRLQSEGALPKRRRSVTKVDSKISNNHNYANPTRSRSKSRSSNRESWQMITSRKSSRNRNEQSRTDSAVFYSRKSKPSEVIHALKEIINSVKEKEDEEKEENAVNNMSNNDFFNIKESDDGLQALSNRDASAKISWSDEARLIKNKHFDESNQSFDQSFWKSISTQTEKDLDSTEILKLTQIATQSSSSCNNVVETGCNTMHYNATCKDAGVSCDLIGSTNLKDIDSTAIADKTPTLENVPVHTESIMYECESNAEDEYCDKSKKLLINKCKQTLNTEMILKLEDYDTIEIPATMTNDFIRDEEKLIDRNSQTFLKLPKNFDNKTDIDIDIDTRQVSTKYSNDSIDNLFSERSRRPSSSIYDYDASCSSEEFAEYLDNDVQHGDMKLKMENIPSDVIAAFELAAERARNLHKAIIIYYENLSEKTEKRDEKTAENGYETLERCASFVNCEIDNRKRSKCNVKSCHFDVANGDDIDGFSTCSSRSSNSVQVYEPALHYVKVSIADYCELVNKKKIKPSSNLFLRDIQEEMKEDKSDDGDFEATGAIKTLAFPMTVEKTSPIISHENLLPLIYCILCFILFWYLQVSFQCDPTT